MADLDSKQLLLDKADFTFILSQVGKGKWDQPKISRATFPEWEKQKWFRKMGALLFESSPGLHQ
ncbi:MAG: hypothetical protein LAN63_15105 [Acidobacteriia bacterium]|nr:hypothetical protein [Terriglobia bacterium]